MFLQLISALVLAGVDIAHSHGAALLLKTAAVALANMVRDSEDHTRIRHAVWAAAVIVVEVLRVHLMAAAIPVVVVLRVHLMAAAIIRIELMEMLNWRPKMIHVSVVVVEEGRNVHHLNVEAFQGRQ